MDYNVLNIVNPTFQYTTDSVKPAAVNGDPVVSSDSTL